MEFEFWLFQVIAPLGIIVGGLMWYVFTKVKSKPRPPTDEELLRQMREKLYREPEVWQRGGLRRPPENPNRVVEPRDRSKSSPP